MEPSDPVDSLESRLKSLPLRPPSSAFGRPETFAALVDGARHPQPPSQRKTTMLRRSKFAAAAALAAGIAFLCFALAGPTGPSAAWSQVVERLRKAQTLTFDSVVSFAADGKVLATNRNYHRVPGKTRTEIKGAGDESGFVVFNIPAGQALMVDAKRKTAHVSPLRAAEGQDMAAETIEHVQSLSDEGARALGEKTIDGRAARGFEIAGKTTTTTVWADASTGRPLRVELLQKDFRGGPVVETWTNIKLDEPLDDALFSVEPPPGYAAQPFLPVDFNATPADFAAKFLKLYADHMDGQLPAQFKDASQALAEKIKPANPEAPPSEAAMQAAFYSAGLSAMVNRGVEGADWRYYPGRQLGDKEAIVFWARDRRKDSYHAVYGDLRVEPIDQADLPPAE